MVVPDLIYDVGLHVGNDTASYLRDGYRVIAIEASPILVEHCRQRFANELASGQLQILPIGISDKTGSQPFYVNPRNDEWSSFDKEVGWRDGEGVLIEVPTTRMEVVFEAYGVPYFLKSDIEWGDIHVLNALKSLQKDNLPYYVSVELNAFDYLLILRSLGYEQFKVIDMKAHGVLAWSGPWGEKSPGQWVPVEAAAYEWLHWFMQHPERQEWLNRDQQTWFDLHAKRTW